MVPSGNNDKPLEDIILKDIIIHVDPFENVMTELHDKDEKAKQIREKSEARIAKDKLIQKSRPTDTGSSEIGKYLKKRTEIEKLESDRPSSQAKKKIARGFDFSSW